jgi:hypothetical protein
LLGKKNIFIQNKTVKIGLMMCLPNNPLGKKFLNKKSNKPNKTLVPDPKQNQSV